MKCPLERKSTLNIIFSLSYQADTHQFRGRFCPCRYLKYLLKLRRLEILQLKEYLKRYQSVAKVEPSPTAEAQLLLASDDNEGEVKNIMLATASTPFTFSGPFSLPASARTPFAIGNETRHLATQIASGPHANAADLTFFTSSFVGRNLTRAEWNTGRNALWHFDKKIAEGTSRFDGAILETESDSTKKAFMKDTHFKRLHISLLLFLLTAPEDIAAPTRSTLQTHFSEAARTSTILRTLTRPDTSAFDYAALSADHAVERALAYQTLTSKALGNPVSRDDLLEREILFQLGLLDADKKVRNSAKKGLLAWAEQMKGLPGDVVPPEKPIFSR